MSKKLDKRIILIIIAAAFALLLISYIAYQMGQSTPSDSIEEQDTDSSLDGVASSDTDDRTVLPFDRRYYSKNYQRSPFLTDAVEDAGYARILKYMETLPPDTEAPEADVDDATSAISDTTPQARPKQPVEEPVNTAPQPPATQNEADEQKTANKVDELKAELKALRKEAPNQQAKSTDILDTDETLNKAGGKIENKAPTTAKKIPVSPIVTLQLPTIIDGVPSKPVTSQATIAELQKVVPSELANALEGLVDDETKSRIEALGDEFLAIDEIKEQTGVELYLDPKTLSIGANIPNTGLRQRRLSLSQRKFISNATLVQPSRFATGLTYALRISDNLSDQNSPTYNLLFKGFTNIGGVKGVNIDFGGTYFYNSENGNSNFRRGRIIAFKDDVERVLRYSLGDISQIPDRLSGSIDILGISVERSYNQLQPLQNIRPLGRSSFLLERPSIVEVYSNGVLLSSFSADPGPIELDNIPTNEISNNITIVVEDAFGRREVDSFNLTTNFNLLEPGIDEFKFSAGVRRERGANQFEYTEEPIISGTYTRGITNSLTANINGSYTEDISTLGVGARFGALKGVFVTDAVVSQGKDTGTGYALGIDYRGGPFPSGLKNDFLTFRADYFSEDFANLSTFDIGLSREFETALTYRFDVTEHIAASLGSTLSRNRQIDDPDYSIFGGVSSRFRGFNFGATLRHINRALGEEETGFFVSAARPIGKLLSASASYDSINERSRFNLRRRSSLGIPDLSYRLRVDQTPENTNVRGSATYTAQRFKTDLDITQRFPDGTTDDSTVAQLSFQSGIAFVDGKVGLGRDPATGFFLVSKHRSLKDAEVLVKDSGARRILGKTDRLGPAVLPVGSPYRYRALSVDLENAPPGYNIGDGQYFAEPGARSGISIQVGSDAYRTVVAKLTYLGEPLSLAFGSARREGTDERVAFFTNRTGRAAFNELAPGKYIATVKGLNLQFEFEVQKTDPAYIDLGEILMRPGA